MKSIAMLAGIAGLLCGVVTTSGCQSATPGADPGALFSLDESKLVDLTYAFDASTIYWPTNQRFIQDVVSHGQSAGGYWYASNDFCASEHGGTHLDAPIHFGEGRASVENIPIERFIGPAVVIDISAACAADPDYVVQVDDVLAWEKQHGAIPQGAIVLVRTGWGARWREPQRYLGSKTPGDVTTLHFPGYSKPAAEFLVHERQIDAIGIDTASLDAGASKSFEAHQVFAAEDMPGFENVANLHLLPEQGAHIIALPMKIGAGTGSPTRIVAVLP